MSFDSPLTDYATLMASVRSGNSQAIKLRLIDLAAAYREAVDLYLETGRSTVGEIEGEIEVLEGVLRRPENPTANASWLREYYASR
jgi:hypothetical protein